MTLEEYDSQDSPILEDSCTSKETVIAMHQVLPRGVDWFM